MKSHAGLHLSGRPDINAVKHQYLPREAGDHQVECDVAAASVVPATDRVYRAAGGSRRRLGAPGFGVTFTANVSSGRLFM